MKKQTLIWVVIMVMVFSGLVSATTKVQYLIGGNGNNAPRQMGSSKNPLEGGFITDIIVEIFSDSPYELEPVVSSWPRLINGIKKGKYENWILYGSKKDAFKEAETTSEIIYESNRLLVTKDKKNFNFSGIEDLFGKKLALVYKYNYGKLDSYLKEGKIKAYRPKTTIQSLKMLKNERAFAHVGTGILIKYNMKQLGFKLDNYQFHNFNSIWEPVNIGFQYDENMPEKLKRFLDKRLKQLKEKGKIASIMNKYK